MKLAYLISAFLITATHLNATILREPPSGCPSIASINAHKTEFLKAHINQEVQIGKSKFRVVYLTHSQPSTSMSTYTNAIINPDFNGRAKCDYATRAPSLGMVTYYLGLEPVK